MKPYFCFPEIKASEVDEVGSIIDGETIAGHMSLYPVTNALSAGFSWSLFLCQCSGERLTASAALLSTVTLLRDRGRAMVIRVAAPDGSLRRYVYVDNIGILCPGHTFVWHTFHRAEEVFKLRRLDLHGTEVKSGPMETLGLMDNIGSIQIDIIQHNLNNIL